MTNQVPEQSTERSQSIIARLQLVFGISVVLLLVSSYASYFSIQKLIDSSKWVNHTYEVMLEADKTISAVKDGVSSQRAYLLTHKEIFIEPYHASYSEVQSHISRLKGITNDNPEQQENVKELQRLVNDRFTQMQVVMRLDSSRRSGFDTAYYPQRDAELMKGRMIMEDLRKAVDIIRGEEQTLLKVRMDELSKYTNYTPMLILIAAILSILITVSAYFRIKSELDARLAKQIEDERLYAETSKRITIMQGVTAQIASGNYSTRSLDKKEDELGRVSTALNEMATALEVNFNEIKRKDWLQTGIVNVSESLRGKILVNELAENVLQGLVSYTGATAATFYMAENDYEFLLASTYAGANSPQKLYPGEGLTGQAIKSRQTTVISNLPAGYLPVTSSLGNAENVSVIMLPLVFNDKVIGIIELGYLQLPPADYITYLESVREPIAIAVNTSINFTQIKELLEKSQAQSEELQAQHAELENLNTELEAQTQKLQASEEELRVQQEELVQANHELQERSRLLEDRNEQITERNNEIQRKAEELALSTKYKSEFLANMSHELRTPLNSILLLSRLLSENGEKNLNNDQVEYAQVIQASGNGLLNLIDEILDLSKIESGKMTLEFASTGIENIVNDIRPLFAPVAKDKGLEFKVEVAKEAPQFIETDKFRLEQILKNLLSNAIKFTATGSVTLSIGKCPNGKDLICFSVIDTGIGIAENKQHLVFEAFQQADGSTKRKFGGTGLGLSISRELAKLLGGEIVLSSETGVGSKFTLWVPINKPEETAEEPPIFKPELPKPVAKPKAEEPKDEKPERQRFISPNIPAAIPDDRDAVKPGDKVILIVEDDTGFAKALLDYARGKGYKGIVAVSGDEGIRLAGLHNPIGILLDIQLPVKDGWEVMDELKGSASTKHIPVHIMSSYQVKHESLVKGAIDFINKPMAFDQMQDVFKKIEHILAKKEKKVLIVEENPQHAKALAYFLQNFNITPEIKSSVDDSVKALKAKDVDCVILDMGIPDAGAYTTLETIKKNPGLENLPIIVFTGKSFSKNEEQKLKTYADSIVVKTAHSYQRILDEVSLFLHLVSKDKEQGNKYQRNGTLEEVLKDKTIMVVDDDVRNIYSLSKALEQYKMRVITATDGKEALSTLEANPDTKVVLMDIMMPEMDGYEAIKNIRKIRKHAQLPVIAVTAKAMTGDREKCIEAGASDYISKPVDIDQLLSLLRVWLYEK